jgi:hypothetical protein
MGSLADLILATHSDVPDIVASDYPLGTFKGTNVDGLDPLMLAALHALLLERPVEEFADQYQPIAEASPEGPWLVKIPSELLEHLSRIAPHDHEVYAEKWAGTSQLLADGWRTEEVEILLEPLILYAQSMSGSDKDLFLWTYG